MQTHDQLIKKLMRHRRVRVEVQVVDREKFATLDAMLKRREAGLFHVGTPEPNTR